MASMGRRDDEAGRPKGTAKKRAVSSKYDVHKVKVWLGDQMDHYYILSRFLISRSLTITKIPSTKAVKIALELKKHLVDHDKLSVTQAELEETLFSLMRAKGYGQAYIDCYRTVSAFYTLRQPLIIIVCGAPCTGKSTIAQQLAARLNMPNVMQTDVICELMRRSPSGALPAEPPWARAYHPPGKQAAATAATAAAATVGDGGVRGYGCGGASTRGGTSGAGASANFGSGDRTRLDAYEGGGAGGPGLTSRAMSSRAQRVPPAGGPTGVSGGSSCGGGSDDDGDEDQRWRRQHGEVEVEAASGVDAWLLEQFRAECGVVRKALQGDFNKALNDGKPLIVEGSHLDPGQLIGELQELGIVLLPLEPVPTTPGSSQRGESPSPQPQPPQQHVFGLGGATSPEGAVTGPESPPAAAEAAETALAAEAGRAGSGSDGGGSLPAPPAPPAHGPAGADASTADEAAGAAAAGGSLGSAQCGAAGSGPLLLAATSPRAPSPCGLEPGGAAAPSLPSPHTPPAGGPDAATTTAAAAPSPQSDPPPRGGAAASADAAGVCAGVCAGAGAGALRARQASPQPCEPQRARQLQKHVSWGHLGPVVREMEEAVKQPGLEARGACGSPTGAGTGASAGYDGVGTAQLLQPPRGNPSPDLHGVALGAASGDSANSCCAEVSLLDSAPGRVPPEPTASPTPSSEAPLWRAAEPSASAGAAGDSGPGAAAPVAAATAAAPAEGGGGCGPAGVVHGLRCGGLASGGTGTPVRSPRSPAARQPHDGGEPVPQADSPEPGGWGASSHGGSSARTSVAGGGGGGADSHDGPLSDVDNYGDADTDGDGRDSGDAVSPLRGASPSAMAAAAGSPRHQAGPAAAAAAALDALALLRRAVSHPVMPSPGGDAVNEQQYFGGADGDGVVVAAVEATASAPATAAPAPAGSDGRRAGGARLVPGLPVGGGGAYSTAAAGEGAAAGFGGGGGPSVAAQLLDRTRSQNAKLFGAGPGPAGGRTPPLLVASASASFGRTGSWSTLDLHHVKSSLAGLLRMGSAAHCSRLSPSPGLTRGATVRSSMGGLATDGASPSSASPGGAAPGGSGRVAAPAGSAGGAAGGTPPLLRAFSAAAKLSQQGEGEEEGEAPSQPWRTQQREERQQERREEEERQWQEQQQQQRREEAGAASASADVSASDAPVSAAAVVAEAPGASAPAQAEAAPGADAAHGDSASGAPLPAVPHASTAAPPSAQHGGVVGASAGGGGGGAPSLPPLFVPVVLRMREADHRLALEDNMAPHGGGGAGLWGGGAGAALARHAQAQAQAHAGSRGSDGEGEGEPDPEEVLRRAQIIQHYLCSFESQGLPVVHVRYGYFGEALDILHEYVLMCIQAAMEQLSEVRPSDTGATLAGDVS